MRRLEARAKAEADTERQRRAEAERSANGQARNAEAKCPSLWKMPCGPCAEQLPPTLNCISCRPRQRLAVLRQRASPVWTRPVRSSWPVTSPMRRTTNSRRACGSATLVTLAQAGIALPKDASGAPKRSGDLGQWLLQRDGGAGIGGLRIRSVHRHGRQRHHGSEPRRALHPPRRRAHGGKSADADGKALYARRKVIVEPVFGQIKEARGFRRFLLRGLQKSAGNGASCAWP